MAGNSSQGDTDKDSRDSASSSRGSSSSSSSSSSRGNSSQGDTDKDSRDSKSSSSSGKSSGGGGGLSSLADSIGGMFDSIGSAIGSAFGGGGGSNGGNGSDRSGGSQSSSMSAADRAAAQEKTASIKDKDASPQAANRARQESRFSGNAATIAGELAEAGWKDHQIEGALGRLQQESSLNPNATRKNDNMKAAPGLRDSIGIAQWNGDRQKDLKDFAESKGKSYKDLATQAQFMAHELNNKEKYAGSQLSKATTREEAAKAMMHYERPQGYTRANPAGGHGYANTLANAAAFGEGRGLATTKGANAGPQDVAASSTAAQRTQGMSNPGNAYVDPAVSTVASRAAAGATEKKSVVGGAVEAIDGLLGTNIGKTVANLEKDPASRERLGLGKLAEKAKAEDGLGVLKEVASAVRDPIGFVLDSIEDGWNQNGGLKGIGITDFKGFDMDFNFAAGGGKGFAGQGSADGGSGVGISQSNSESAFLPVQQAVAAVAPARKPFGWSTLS